MRRFRIGSAFGIPVLLDLTFLLVLPLFAWIIGAQVEYWVRWLDRLPGATFDAASLTAGTTPWVLGIAATVGLFVGVVFHELGHSLVAMRHGYPIESITLWLFGGIAELARTPENWREEFAIAVAGPIVSVAAGVGCLLVFYLVPGDFAALRFVVGFLAVMNLVLAAFNLLPGFPMDGGRVLRALLARSFPFAEATRIAAEVGKLFALLLGLVGILRFDVVLIAVAFFIYAGAAGEAQQTATRAAFEGVTVRDVMTPREDVSTTPRDATVAELVERLFRERHTAFPVMEGDRPVGLVTLEDARSIKPVEREAFLVEDVMATDLATVDANEEATAAFAELQRHDVGRLLVEDDGEFAGIVTRSDLVTALNVLRSRGSSPADTPASDSGSGPAVDEDPASGDEARRG